MAGSQEKRSWKVLAGNIYQANTQKLAEAGIGSLKAFEAVVTNDTTGIVSMAVRISRILGKTATDIQECKQHCIAKGGTAMFVNLSEETATHWLIEEVHIFDPPLPWPYKKSWPQFTHGLDVLMWPVSIRRQLRPLGLEACVCARVLFLLVVCL